MGNASLNAMHQDRYEADAYRRIELVRRRRWTIEEKAAIRRSPVRCQSRAVADLATQSDG
jgi:hypothetical protein